MDLDASFVPGHRKLQKRFMQGGDSVADATRETRCHQGAHRTFWSAGLSDAEAPWSDLEETVKCQIEWSSTWGELTRRFGADIICQAQAIIK